MVEIAFSSASLGLALLAGISATLLAVFVRRQLSPIIAPRVSAQWLTDERPLVVLTLELENVSPVRVLKDKVVLRVREFDPETGLDGYDAVCRGEEWLTLGSPWVERREEEHGVHCSLGPCEVFESTVFLNPKECVRVPRVYEAGQSAILHVGLQFRVRFPWWIEGLDRITRLWNFRLPLNLRSGLSRQTTSTWYICRDVAPGS